MCKKFKILVLVDLGGTIFFRTDKKDITTRSNDFKIKRYEYYMRPGFKSFLKRIFEHPRSKFCFYSSIMRQNLVPILFAVLDDKFGLMDFRDKIGTFDQAYCSLMKDHPYYTNLQEDPWDTYRDLEKVFASDFCKKNNFNVANTLLLDSSECKV